MRPIPWADAAIILALILLNGFFAMSELAIVSARRARLQAMARAGRRGAQRALQLAEHPARLLSATQMGITLVAVLSGAYSGSALGGPLGDRLAVAGIDPHTAEQLGFATAIAATTYLSIVVGELIPKQLAIGAAEPIAAATSRPMAAFARAVAPAVWVLERSSALLMRALRLRRRTSSAVTAEEVEAVVAEATTSGTIEETERQMISGILRLGERTVRGVMTPRTDVDWLDLDAPDTELRTRLVATPHSRLPVADGSVDRIVGVVQARDLLASVLGGAPLDLRAHVRRAKVIPDVMDATDAMIALQSAEVPMAMVHDEYGHFEGIVTPIDLLRAIAGAFRSDEDPGDDPDAVQREDGSWLLAGGMSAGEMAGLLGLTLPTERDYETVAGFVLAVLRRLPATGEHFTYGRWRFEVVDLDGRKIDKVLAQPVAMLGDMMGAGASERR
jgi:putative hemolysin